MDHYQLPLAFTFALQTDRKELLAAFIVNPVLTTKEQSELVRLVGDLIEARRATEDKLELLSQVAAEACRAAYGNARKVERAFEAFHDVATRSEMHEAIRRKQEDE